MAMRIFPSPLPRRLVMLGSGRMEVLETMFVHTVVQAAVS